MRALGWFLAALFGTLVLASLLAWPAWQAVQAAGGDWPFHRVVGRFWQLMLLVALVIAVRRIGLAGREDWGYGLPRARFARQFGAGLAVGVATMLPMSCAMIALGILAPRPGLDAAALLEAIAAGALTGLAVAAVEETFFRGLMFRALLRESGVAFAAVATAIVYAAIHFLARAKIPAEEVAWDSGLRLLGAALAHFADPAGIIDAFLTLVLVGLLLALVRARTGAIAAGAGLHAGWVMVIKSTTALTRPDAESRWAFLVGAHDGYTGWLVAGWAALLIAAAWAGGWLKPGRDGLRTA